MKKLNQKVKWSHLYQLHSAKQWQSKNMNPESLAPESALLNIMEWSIFMW